MTTPDSEPHIFQCLTQREWKMVFSVQFLADWEDYGDAFPIERYATLGLEGEADTYEESFRRAIRWLFWEHGVQFRSLQPQEDGRIFGDVVCTENILYANLLSLGKLPDVLGALRVLLETAPASMDTAPVSEAIHEIERVVEDVSGSMDKRQVQEGIEAMQNAVEQWGIEVKGRVIH